MKKIVRATAMLAAIAVSFLAAEGALAVPKTIKFKGTVAQVKAACKAAANAGDEVTSYPTDNGNVQTGWTCENSSNGNAVHCDNAGNCTGTINTGRAATGKPKTGPAAAVMQDILSSGGAAQ
jgi:hypothetical protein